MIRFARVVLLASLLAIPAASLAQRGPDAGVPAQKTAMEKLAYMVGDWEGTGTMQMGPERKETFHGGEKVQSKLQGLTLLVEGAFFRTEEGGVEKPVHTTLGVISYSPQDSKYKFRYWLASGATGDRDLTLTADGWYWELPAGPGATVRYTMKLAEGAWSEIGERTADGGKTWNKFFEMALKKKA